MSAWDMEDDNWGGETTECRRSSTNVNDDSWYDESMPSSRQKADTYQQRSKTVPDRVQFGGRKGLRQNNSYSRSDENTFRQNDNRKGCFKCGEEGHISRDCLSGRGSRRSACFKCGKEGHRSRDCPNTNSRNQSGSPRTYNNYTRHDDFQLNGDNGSWDIAATSGPSNNYNSSSNNKFGSNADVDSWDNIISTNGKLSSGFGSSRPTYGGSNSGFHGWDDSASNGNTANCNATSNKVDYGWRGNADERYSNSLTADPPSVDYNSKPRDRGCFKCGEEGHRSRDCPSRGGERKKGCFKCGDESHMSRDCPNGGERGGTSYGESITMKVQDNYCGRIIGKGGSKIQELQEISGARIKLRSDDRENGEVPVIISGTSEAREKAKELIEEIISEADMYRKPRPPAPEPVYNENGVRKGFTSEGHLDWGFVLKESEENRRAKWSELPDVIKDFYVEDDDVSDMTPKEVAHWRRDNFNLTVVDLSNENRPILNPAITFEHAFHHYPEILAQIYKQGFKKPSPIQSQFWPIALRGYDVIGIAQTGTGKTLAFLLPAFIHIDLQKTPRPERQGPSALVLTPTRELALQIEQEINKYSYRGIRSVCVYGGGDRRKQVKAVMGGVEIIVATPGRFNDLLECEIICLKSVTLLVLDEADRMLDMGFEPQILKILLDVRPDRQTFMTSATWPTGVRRLSQKYMADPFQVNVGSLDLAATHTVSQVIEIVDEEEKRARLYQFIQEMQPEDKALIFVGKKSTCDDVSSDLSLRDIPCQSIHGGREQFDREQALDDFKNSYVPILIATDVASRGLDVKDISHVFNYDFPRNVEEYVHRVGRTGRAGRSGVSLSLVTRNDWGSAKELIAILEEAEQYVPDELHEMAQRFQKMKERRAMERGGGGGGRGRFRGSSRRGGPRW